MERVGDCGNVRESEECKWVIFELCRTKQKVSHLTRHPYNGPPSHPSCKSSKSSGANDWGSKNSETSLNAFLAPAFVAYACVPTPSVCAGLLRPAFCSSCLLSRALMSEDELLPALFSVMRLLSHVFSVSSCPILASSC